MPSLTLTAQGGLLRVLITKCKVAAAFHPGLTPQHQYPPHVEFDAIWDTGASASVITQQVVDACGLKPTGMAQVQGVHGTENAETFLVNMLLQSGVGFVSLQVTKGNLGNGPQVLLGMDVISLGDFAVTSKNGNSVMSFRMPSQACIDFVKEENQLLQQAAGPSHGGGTHRQKRPPKMFGKNKRARKK